MFYWMKNRQNAVRKTIILDDEIYEKIKQIQMDTLETKNRSVSYSEIIDKLLKTEIN